MLYVIVTLLTGDMLLVQVIVSGKLRAQRAKSMKFKDGYMISSGQPVNEYIDSAVRHVLLRQVCPGHLFLPSVVLHESVCSVQMVLCYKWSNHFMYLHTGCTWY